jgi:putative addiction module component (TIGR02574 family)
MPFRIGVFAVGHYNEANFLLEEMPMSHSAEALLESALSLPEDERAAIIDALLSSLADDTTDMEETQFSEELRRRSEEMKNDPAASVAWSELKKLR